MEITRATRPTPLKANLAGRAALLKLVGTAVLEDVFVGVVTGVVVLEPGVVIGDVRVVPKGVVLVLLVLVLVLFDEVVVELDEVVVVDELVVEDVEGIDVWLTVDVAVEMAKGFVTARVSVTLLFGVALIV